MSPFDEKNFFLFFVEKNTRSVSVAAKLVHRKIGNVSSVFSC